MPRKSGRAPQQRVIDEKFVDSDKAVGELDVQGLLTTPAGARVMPVLQEWWNIETHTLTSAQAAVDHRMAMVAASAVAAPVVPPVGAGADWPSHGGGVDESSYSRLNQIALRNVSRLGLAWSLDLPDEASLEAIPLAVDGVLYFTGRSKVYAVDGSSGKLFVVRLFGTLRGLD